MPLTGSFTKERSSEAIQLYRNFLLYITAPRLSEMLHYVELSI